MSNLYRGGGVSFRPATSYIENLNKCIYFPIGDTIRYTSIDDQIVNLDSKAKFFDKDGALANIVSNTYKNGIGQIKFDREIAKIGDTIFYQCANLKSISFPDSVTIIGNQFFYNCDNLVNYNFANVNSIGDYCFINCNNLISAFIGPKVSKIGTAIFDGTQNLNSIIVDESNLYYYSENNCILTKSNNILVAGCNFSVIPDNTQGIANGAFTQLRKLSLINIPKKLKSIDYNAFIGCSAKLTEIIVDDENQYYKVDLGCLIEKSTNTLIVGTKNGVIPDYAETICNYAFAYMQIPINDVLIPDSIKTIGNNSFRYYTKSNSKTKLTIGSSVSYIDASSFSCCSWGNIIIKAPTPPQIANDIFNGCYTIGNIYVPDSSVDAYKAADRWSTYADKIKPLSEYQE